MQPLPDGMFDGTGIAMSERAYLTVKEVAAELRIGQDAAYAIVRQIGFRVGVNSGLWRVRREALDKWIADQERNEVCERKAARQRVSRNAGTFGGVVQNRSKARGSGYESDSDGPPIRLTQPRTKKRPAKE